MKNFTELNLSELLAQSVAEMGFTIPTPIQAQTLPILLKKPTDFLGMAATGTGKTAAFGIPLIEQMDGAKKATQAIVLCPTRELAVQTAEQLSRLGKHKKIQVQAVYGGTGYGEQLSAMRRGASVIVATPGRLVDHINQGNLSLAAVTTVVLDEADEMVSMGFKDELEFLLKSLPAENCHRWMFAATMSAELRRVAERYLRNPQNAQVNRTEMLSGTVRQVYYTVRDKNKPKGVCKLIDMAEDFYGLIFCQTKVTVIGLTDYLRVRGYRVDCLHGDKSQFEREKTLKLFREKNTTILVCSDVAARGLDVKELTHVINYSLPTDLDSYVHRIGRTGRSGATGLALSLVSPPQMNLLDRIERRTKSKMEAGIFPTRKEISEKKMIELLPKFTSALGYEKASEVLDANWKTAIEAMTKEEIAGRFLALSNPELFDDREKAEEIGIGERGQHVRPERGERFDARSDDRRGERGDERGDSRGRPARRFSRNERPDSGGGGFGERSRPPMRPQFSQGSRDYRDLKPPSRFGTETVVETPEMRASTDPDEDQPQRGYRRGGGGFNKVKRNTRHPGGPQNKRVYR